MLDCGFTAKCVTYFYAPFSKLNQGMKIRSDYSPVGVLGVKQVGNHMFKPYLSHCLWVKHDNTSLKTHNIRRCADREKKRMNRADAEKIILNDTETMMQQTANSGLEQSCGLLITCGSSSTVGLTAGAAHVHIQLIFCLRRGGGGWVAAQLITGTAGAVEKSVLPACNHFTFLALQ